MSRADRAIALFLLSVVAVAADELVAAPRSRDPRKALRKAHERLRAAARLGCQALELPPTDRGALERAVTEALAGEADREGLAS